MLKLKKRAKQNMNVIWIAPRQRRTTFLEIE